MLYPKIGIRPVIDGRCGGVREGLEDKTFGMALTAKQILETLQYPDGSPLQCVISPSSISGSKEASDCEDFFITENVIATLTVTPCWCYGSETMDMNPYTLKAVWGFNATERPGAVYLAAVLSAHAQKGRPAFSIYGRDVQDMDDTSVPDDVYEKIMQFARCAIAVGWMKNKSYLNIGGVSMGITGSYCDASVFQKYFGIRAEWVDMCEVLRRIKLDIYDPEEYSKAYAWVKANCKEGIDINLDKNFPDIIQKSKVIAPEDDWSFVVKMTLAIRDIMQGNTKLNDLGWSEESKGKNAVAGGFQGQRSWTDWLPNGDFSEAILASSFDWNGTRMPITLATENDTLNGLSMLVESLITHSAPCFHDVRTYWSPESVLRVTGHPLAGAASHGIIHMINSGATALDCTGASVNEKGEHLMKKWYHMTPTDVEACLRETDWCRANYEYFRGGGFSSHFATSAEMPVTLLRLNIIDGIGPVAQIAQGQTVVLPKGVHDKLDYRTDRTWPTTWFAPLLTGVAPFDNVYNVMANWGANHGVTVFGHIGPELITLFSMLRIPVAMHNVPSHQIFRPHSWSAFGTDDKQAADYMACKRYGPLYG